MLAIHTVKEERILRNQLVVFPDGESKTIKEIWDDFILLEDFDGNTSKLKKEDFHFLSPMGDGNWEIKFMK